jgi:hypothetical protein
MNRILGGVLVLAVACTARALPLESVQTWTAPGAAGWTNEAASAVATNAGGYLELKFTAQSAPSLVIDRATAALPGTVWITNVAFRLQAFGPPPSALRLVLRSAASGATWQRSLALPPAPGWMSYAIPVAFTPAWYTGPSSTEADFNADRRQFDQVGLYVSRHGSAEEQRYGLDDVVVQGYSTGPGDGDGDGMDDTWESANALNANDPTDGAVDGDGDGMSNYAEFRAGTDWQDPDSRWTLGLQGTFPQAGIILKWDSISNRSYTILRTLDMLDTNYSVLEAGVAATPPTNSYPDTDAVNWPHSYYRILVDP